MFSAAARGEVDGGMLSPPSRRMHARIHGAVEGSVAPSSGKRTDAPKHTVHYTTE